MCSCKRTGKIRFFKGVTFVAVLRKQVDAVVLSPTAEPGLQVFAPVPAVFLTF
jgi:hypothetical protein